MPRPSFVSRSITPTLGIFFWTLVGIAGFVSAATADDDAWWQKVQADIADGEYAVRQQVDEQGSRLQAPNRAQGFRSTFDRRGVSLEPRDVVRSTLADDAWSWGLSLTRISRGGIGRQDVEALAPIADRRAPNRVHYPRAGHDEWFVNDPEGLEHGFTFYTPPRPGGEKTGDLRLELELSGTLSARLDSDRRGADFLDASGQRRLRYAGLQVNDATGAELSAWMEAWNRAGRRGLTIRVDDRDAVYPIVVDPLATVPGWTSDGDLAGAAHGAAATGVGDVNDDGFDDIVVAAPRFDGGLVDEGRVQLFLGAAGGPGTTPAWTVEGEQAGALFGSSVAAAGDLNGDGIADLAIGAEAYLTGGGGRDGAAYAYLGSSSGPALVADWMVESPLGMTLGDDRFGASVAAAGDIDGDGFGDLIIGAPGYGQPESAEGAAALFLGSAVLPATTPAWLFEGDQIDAAVGTSVAWAGDINGDGFADVVVGAPGYNDLPVGEGTAFAFYGGAGGLASTPDWSFDSNQPDAGLGGSVASAGDVNGDGFSDVIVGAEGFDAATVDSGRSFVFHGSAAGLSVGPDWFRSPFQPQGSLGGLRSGRSVASAGDINGDGYADVIVGIPFGNANDSDGAVEAFYGSSDGLALQRAWIASGGQTGSEFGAQVATAGGVNGDGFSDLLVGAPAFDDVAIDEGRTHLFFGGPEGPATDASWQVDGMADFDQLGRSVSGAGDVNGDGFADVIVGAYLVDGVGPQSGRALVYHGNPSGLSAMADWSADGDRAEGLFGYSVSGLGDINGDGYDDVAVGAAFHDNGESDEGRVFVYHGSPTGLAAIPAWDAEGDQIDALFGAAVAGAGDVNGDGYADLLIGAVLHDEMFEDEGRALVYHGSADGLSLVADWTADGAQAEALLGRSVAGAGDINGDGYDDVVVGLPRYDDGQFDEGQARLYLGSAGGLDSSAVWTFSGDQTQALLGNSVTGVGDINGDGFADVVIGAPLQENGEIDEGCAFAFYGSAAGLPVDPNWIG
ncbi:MAG: VCBS repeat-containing protein, partial [Acidobacteriota bacterium]|nr:VCBS repeat-containing protein [Acidobacteriota bacterium]